ncbi:MAG: HEAT repeat domain-containing protein [Pirellulales bacterium]
MLPALLLTMLLSDAIAEYRHADATAHSRRDVLGRLANDGGEEALATFAELVADSPPASVEDALVAFAPLMRPRPNLSVEALFPRLLDAVEHVRVAAIVLDIANHFTRSGRLGPHPASDRAVVLADLFAKVTIGLEKLSTAPPADANTWESQRRTAEEGFALLISLADALALVGDRSVCDKLRPALELPHRRLRTEVAAALARLGQADGIAALATMTAEPVVRARAIYYLEELGLADEIPGQHRTPTAKAEGVLAEWLAAPLQLGLAPHAIELLDHRKQFWPGYEEPVECFLLRYAYSAAQGELRGVGIVGPLVHATACDVDDLPPEDVYALFAGYHAEHEQIQETPLANLSGVEWDAVDTLCRDLNVLFTEVTPVEVGRFFGERHIVATAKRGGQPGTVVLDSNEPHWYRAGEPQRPLGIDEAYQIHKGRKLLAAFNSSPSDAKNG